MVAKVFIDGEAGTTGLQIRDRLAHRREFQLLSIDPHRRKDETARRLLLNSADFVLLCLPDEAAREAVSLIDNEAVRVIDASTAHRTSEGWTYGFPELATDQADAIRRARRVANPGCYATGAIALLRPLVDTGLLPKDWPISINAVSGYTGGGRAMIEEFEAHPTGGPRAPPFRIYALELAHKHIPEMAYHIGLSHSPVFAPSVARYAQGMIVEIPLPLWAVPGRPTVADVHAVLAGRYSGTGFVEVIGLEAAAKLKTLDPEGLNGTNRLQLFVFGNPAAGQARLVALLDNLGKGAAGAAVQNLNLMAGLQDGAGLSSD